MSGNWDTYFCEVDDMPASILVDLDFALSAPLDQYPVLGYINLALNLPDKEGFPRQDEYQALAEIEDALATTLCADNAAVYVGRCIRDGQFELFFYIPTGEGWADRVFPLMEQFAAFHWEAGIQNDPHWMNYLQFLFPDEYSMLDIQNRRGLQELQELGDDPEQARPIEHLAGFPTLEEASAFSDALRQRGFHVTDPDSEHAATIEEFQEYGSAYGGSFHVHFSRRDTTESLDDIVVTLLDLTRDFGGVYHGWSAPAVI